MADRALDSLSQANEELRVDIDKWKEAKDREINRLMRKVSDDHINFHQKVWPYLFQLNIHRLYHDLVYVVRIHV